MSDGLPTHNNPEVLDLLINAYFDGGISDENHAKLCELLRSDRENAKAFARFSVIHHRLGELMSHERGSLLASLDIHDIHAAELIDALDDKNHTAQIVDITASVLEEEKRKGAAKAAEDGRMELEPSPIVIVIPKAVVYLAMAAAIAILASVTAYFLPNKQAATITAQVEENPEIKPATLVDQDGAVWADGQPLLAGTEFIAGQKLSLISGVIELSFFRGAEVILEGPCEVQIIDDNALRLHSGQLVAQAGGTANYFSVLTPTAKVMDFGTEFGVKVDGQTATQVAVFDGLVSLQSSLEQQGNTNNSLQPLMISEGKKSGVDRDGVVSTAVSDLADTDSIMFARSLESYRSPLFQYQRAILKAAPIAYWNFESENSKRVQNEVNPGVNDLIGFGNVQVVKDGAMGKAASFKSHKAPLDYFLMDGELEFNTAARSYTIELLFNSSRQQFATIAKLFVELDDPGMPFGAYAAVDVTDSAGVNAGRIKHWRNNTVRVFHRNPPSAKMSDRNNLFGLADYSVNTWQHVALVKSAGKLALYIDGLLVDETQDSSGTQAAVRMIIGASPGAVLSADTNAGNKPQQSDDMSARPFVGLIDEVAVYNRALAADEIATHKAIWDKQRNNLNP